MPIDINNAQDVYKDAGDNINFTTLLLKRTNQGAELEAVQEPAERIPAVIRSMNVRYPKAYLKVTFGIGSSAWDYLFPAAAKPKELVDFEQIEGPKYTAVATPGDLFFHVRAHEMAVVYEVMDQLMQFIRPVTTVADETHGFRYFEGRAVIGFIDGSENPDPGEAAEYALVGDEDPEFIDGSYAFAQKYIHNMKAWNKTTTEDQEKTIGRKKYSDLELSDEEKAKNAHNVVSQDNDGGVEHKIVRMNVPFSNPGKEVTGTYFIGYGHYTVTRRMLESMFTNSDRLLDFSTPITGAVYFVPSKSILDKISAGEL
ncbi:peroxidase [Loigolactobacillus backii]|uniref:Dyp-type peroxidase n=1 Tax=Loigolactobacillus backii TaxID=375175 RepID=UPI0007F0D9D6|nr:Dyp-type peroxidase [Loigolactobacillus backii]ANK65328.1 peroxidase [Loigolactobacillus backii]